MNVWWAIALMALAACGNDNGNNDTILGGFSGVLIFGLIVWLVFRYFVKKDKSGGSK
jgi:hypothetical protein